MSLSDAEEALAKHVRDRNLTLQLSLDAHKDSWDDDYYDSYVWASPEDRERAHKSDTVWRIEIYGRELDRNLALAASSLAGVMQMLAQYELQPKPPQRRSA